MRGMAKILHMHFAHIWLSTSLPEILDTLLLCLSKLLIEVGILCSIRTWDNYN